jgi:SAM-dependent methyltransferase
MTIKSSPSSGLRLDEPRQDTRDNRSDGRGHALSPGAFFDRDDVLALYRQLRDDSAAPVLTIERPIMLDMIGTPKRREFLDLGCGNAWIGRHLLELGARRYLGLDVSCRLLEEARLMLAGTAGELQLQDLEWWCGGNVGLFDVVISRLALQYVRNIAKVFEVVRHHLRPGGLFVFSVEHPVLTSSCDRQSGKPIARDWPLRDYFREGPRSDGWLGAVVLKHHRSMESYVEQIREHGFLIDRFSEGRPARENFATDALHEARLDVPMCIIFRCIRD